MKQELNRELAKTIEKMTTAKLALRATAPLSLRCQKAYVKYQALKNKVNRIFQRLEQLENVSDKEKEGTQIYKSDLY